MKQWKKWMVMLAACMMMLFAASPVFAEVTSQKAYNIARSAAGVKKSDVRMWQVETDDDTGIYYEVEFSTNTYSYDYEVRKSDGKILKEGREIRARKVSGSKISLAKAKKIAKVHAKKRTKKILKTSKFKAVNVHSEKETDEDIPVYEIGFRYKGNSYSYDVSIKGGKIVDYHIEWDR